MSMPPKNPMGTNKSYFELLCDLATPYLSFSISLDGYDDAVEKYQTTPAQSPANWELAKELNAWSEYIAEIANMIQKEYLDSEADKLNVASQKSIEYSDKVASGDRFANTEANVISARKKRNILKSLYDALESKKSFLDKAFYQCKNSIQLQEKEKVDA